jgi:hypothetical protein
VAALPRWLVGGWRGLERFADGRWGPAAVVAAALASYTLVSLATPLEAGRDLPRYLLAYAQLFQWDVLYPHAILTRTPGTPLVAGLLLEAGPLAAEVGCAVLYAASVLAWCAVARRFGIAAAIATAVALVLYPGYVLLFHRLSSDALFAAAFAFFAVLLARALERPTAGRYGAVGAGVAGLVFVRPAGQALTLLALLPLVAERTWPARVRGAAALLAAAAIPLVGWSVHNHIRLDDFTVVRSGGAAFALFRAFVADRIVEPDNGPASRELATAVSRDLLPYEPYRSYGITLDEFFSSGSFRMHEDLTVLADRTWGWDDDYAHLSRVTREAILAHPWTYARGVAGGFRDLLIWPLYARVEGEAAAPALTTRGRIALTQVVEPLPAPTEGEPIPAARQSAFITTPDGRIREVWTSPADHHLVFPTRAEEQRAGEIDRRVNGLLANLPDRDGNAELADRLNSASRWYPRPIVWLALGLLALAVRRPRRMAVPLILTGCALLILLTTALAVYAVAEYAVPVTPAFVLLATAGLLGPRAASATVPLARGAQPRPQA